MMDKQNELIMARRRSRKQAKLENEYSMARQLLEEAEQHNRSHSAAIVETRSQQDDLVCTTTYVQLRTAGSSVRGSEYVSILIS